MDLYITFLHAWTSYLSIYFLLAFRVQSIFDGYGKCILRDEN